LHHDGSAPGTHSRASHCHRELIPLPQDAL